MRPAGKPSRQKPDDSFAAIFAEAAKQKASKPKSRSARRKAAGLAQLSSYIPAELHRRLAATAKELGVRQSNLLSAAIRDLLDRHAAQVA